MPEKTNCSSCHDTLRAEKKDGHHAPLNCEVCHGPGMKHALYAGKFEKGKLPDSLKLIRPVERKHCALCHNKNAARTKVRYDTLDVSVIKQVNVAEHNLLNDDTKQEQKCIDCHNPHQP